MKHPRCDCHPKAWICEGGEAVEVPVERPCERCLLLTLIDGQDTMKQSVIDLNTQIAAAQANLTTLTADVQTIETTFVNGATSDDPDVVAATQTLAASNTEFAALLTRLGVDLTPKP